MVDQSKILYKLQVTLEMFLIKEANFKLLGWNYKIILFTATDPGNPDTRYKILLSSKFLDLHNPITLSKEILIFLRKHLESTQEYLYVSHIEILNSNHPFVINVSTRFPYRSKLLEIGEMAISGIRMPLSYLVFCERLDAMIEGRATHLLLNDGKIVAAGIKGIDKKFILSYYTGAGLRELWGQNIPPEQYEQVKALRERPEEELIQMNYLAKIKYEDIAGIYKEPDFRDKMALG